MPILSTIGRRSWRVRLLLFTINAVLLAGAISMVYPFLLMLSGSTKSGVDAASARLVPPFLTEEAALYAKYVEGLFNESLDMLRYTYRGDLSSFEQVRPPEATNPALAKAWLEFLEQADLPSYASAAGFIATPVSLGVQPHRLRGFKRQLADGFEGDIQALNRDLGTHFPSWNAFLVLPGHYLLRRNRPGTDPIDLAFRAYKEKIPPGESYYAPIEGFYRAGFLMSQYTRSIESYNEAHDTAHASWDEVRLDRTAPPDEEASKREREDWLSFTRSVLNLLWIDVHPEAALPYRSFLSARYVDIEDLNDTYGTGYAHFDEVPLLPPRESRGPAAGDWDVFLQGWLDPSSGQTHRLAGDLLVIDGPDFRFRDFLLREYGTLDSLNHALGTDYAEAASIAPPQQAVHYLAFRERQGALRYEFAVRNYLSVVDYVLLHGRGLLNTIVYCALAVLGALIVNPLAAYALSRYRPPSAYKVLLVLMLTMAFPPMVTQIPLFLMLREFNLLNTFWALILPGLAHGYSIFLLKGFFDSLPQELYESASIDGAGEFRIFWQITMSLSTPILAVVALNAFTVAYSNFMMALLLCQDEKMWTLMPWLYQLQQRSGAGVVFASLVLAALPTFLVFVFCQNIIMRGIVVPVEK